MGYQSQVKQYLMPEAAVEKVQDSVFGTANIEINRHPVVFLFLTENFIAIVGVDIP